MLRLREGDAILIFNGRDGEFRARLEMTGKRAARLRVEEQTRPQEKSGEVDYAFAPLKQARLDYMAQKAAEMGAGRLSPVLTRRTQLRRVNCERIRANVIEAAEQCGLLSLPEVREPVELTDYLASFPDERVLVFCDEDAPRGDPFDILRAHPSQSCAVSLLVGPEGGFDPAERKLILTKSNVLRISLGPRILRADTAAVAALAVIQTAFGDWR